MKYQILFKPTAVKDLKKLPLPISKRIKIKLEFLIKQPDPMIYSIHLIGNGKGGQYRFRVGDYRIVFDRVEDKLIILYIEHRRKVYR